MAASGGNAYWCYFTCFFLLAGLATPSSFISSDVFNVHAQHSPGRNLAGEPNMCKINFASLDYSEFKGNCKPPLYPTKPCCDALRNFACPHVDDINYIENGCANAMFYNINTHCNYPDGVFFKRCVEEKKGLPCNQVEGIKIMSKTTYRRPRWGRLGRLGRRNFRKRPRTGTPNQH
ncbi:hypothetical protein Tsubulata_047064 [Turnera subulata]|uniref:GPI-anchored protein LLG1-like domain-containing protein n=1 Tax=Turnera subulata TaxID=218843 RepID=A0A9Q0J207_9ROSI|nr:hypothetical protein Tsubulata_047064 [Turnera subulata]